jgi:hypothetical protein
MTARTVLGPHGYSRPPYGSFAGKPTFAPSRTYTQTFTVLGPHAYSRPPYASFAAKQAATIAPAVGMLSGGKVKRWWEELLEEYRAKYPRPSPAKKAVAARRQVKELVEEAILGGLLTELNPVAEIAAKAMVAPGLAETLEYAEKLKAYLAEMEDEEEAILLLLET